MVLLSWDPDDPGPWEKGGTAIPAKLADLLEKLWIFGGQSQPDLF
jgi:hypothetical protein